MRGEVSNSLARLRKERGVAAARLAELAGTSRQTIYAIEAGDYVPNTTLALRLARILEVTVEDLFSLAKEAPEAEAAVTPVHVLPGFDAPQPGQPVRFCRVDARVFAFTPSPLPWFFQAADGVVAAKTGRGKATVHALAAETAEAPRLLIAGCDPAISVLARHAQAAGIELAAAHRNSSQALALLHDHCVHIAGTHLRDEPSGESNLSAVNGIFPRHAVAVVSYAEWEEGIVVARGNPRRIRGIEDLARRDVAIVNREAGAGSRRLLDSHLQRLGIPAHQVRGYAAEAEGHLAAASRVHAGAADACIATRAAARLFGLGFIPLVKERYDLVMRRRHLELPGVQTLLDILSRAAFRRELETLGGYDTKVAGRRIL